MWMVCPTYHRMSIRTGSVNEVPGAMALHVMVDMTGSYQDTHCLSLRQPLVAKSSLSLLGTRLRPELSSAPYSRLHRAT